MIVDLVDYAVILKFPGQYEGYKAADSCTTIGKVDSVIAFLPKDGLSIVP
jgi:hypothetical protein